MSNDGLAVWLAAQIDEDERRANAAPTGSWRVSDRFGDPTEPVTIYAIPDSRLVADDVARLAAPHIAEHDPARELREVEAKRRRLARHAPSSRRMDFTAEAFLGGVVTGACSACGQTWPCPDIRDDASVYAGRPGWREEWVT